MASTRSPASCFTTGSIRPPLPPLREKWGDCTKNARMRRMPVAEFPGVFPFTRGIQPSMYRGRLWTMRQYAGFGSAEESNQRFKYLLSHGQTGLSVAFDLPTLMGYDSDDNSSIGEVGICGVSISSLQDMEVLLDGIPLDKVSTSMTINSPAAMIFAFYLSVAKKQGVSFD